MELGRRISEQTSTPESLLSHELESIRMARRADARILHLVKGLAGTALNAAVTMRDKPAPTPEAGGDAASSRQMSDVLVDAQALCKLLGAGWPDLILF